MKIHIRTAKEDPSSYATSTMTVKDYLKDYLNTQKEDRELTKRIYQAQRDARKVLKETEKAKQEHPERFVKKPEPAQKITYKGKNKTQLYNEFSKLNQSEKETYMEQILSAGNNTIEPITRRKISETLAKEDNPFQSYLYSVVQLLQKNRTKISKLFGNALIGSPRKFYNTFSDKGSNNLTSDFQVKAILYFINRAGNLNVIYNDNKKEWYSERDMKRRIQNMPQDQQNDLKTTRVSRADSIKLQRLEQIKDYLKRRGEDNAFAKTALSEKWTDKDLLNAWEFFKSLIQEEQNA